MNRRTQGGPVSDAQQAALLIDADNLSPEGMAEAFALLRAQGFDVCVRRAYGSAETLTGARDFLQSQAVRAVVNQGKGTTDASLVVDAMDMLHAGLLPGLVAIGSADGDFAPLVLRLREAGRRVVCFAQEHKAPDGLERYYAEVFTVDTPRPRSSRAAASPAAAKAPARKAAARKAPRAVAPAPKPPVAESEGIGARVRAILDSFAGLARGESLELNAVVKKLRDEKLMGKSTSATNFFKLHAPEVELLPKKQPNKLRYRD